jgi:hypothetical protein
LFDISDEEIGGKDGMAKFVNTSDFLELNVGFALDEGMADPSDQFPLFYGERSIWRKYLFKLQFIYLFCIYMCVCVEFLGSTCVCVYCAHTT